MKLEIRPAHPKRMSMDSAVQNKVISETCLERIGFKFPFYY